MLFLFALAGAAPAAGGLKPLLYGAFVLLVVGFLVLDLGVFHRKAHVVSAREAIGWTLVWVAASLAFNVGVYFLYEHHVFGLGLNVPVLGDPGATQTLDGWAAAKQYFAGYVVEKSLAMDNVFVIALIFASLAIPAIHQHRVLFWGILGALAMRAAMIFVGAELVARFSWIVYVFGGFLILTAVKMAVIEGHAADPAASPVVRLTGRIVPLTHRFNGQRFFARIDGRLYATPLLLALVLVEFTDLIFAIDSIPAIFAITADPFIVFTSNIFAILGLRSLYFCLAAAIDHFRYLKPALVLVLLFVGVKMCLVHTPLKIPTDVSLLVILGLLGAGVAASLLRPGARAAGPTEAPQR